MVNSPFRRSVPRFTSLVATQLVATSLAVASLVGVAFPAVAFAGDAPATFPPARLPPGVAVRPSTEATAEQRAAIGRKLGGALDRLVSSVVDVHGRSLQANVLDAATEADADALEASLKKLKPEPFVARRGRTVVEYVGRGVDEALARKTSFELGFVEKPRRARYRVTAELATVERGDDGACNRLFEQFLTPGWETDAARRERIGELRSGFTFGRTLVLRRADLDGGAVERRFQPAAKEVRHGASTSTYEFERTETRAEIPFVVVSLEVVVDDAAPSDDVAKPDLPKPELPTPGDVFVAATELWPARDEELVRLARRITAGADSNDAKVDALLRWLAPGANVKYAGDAGSRWGVRRTLEQGYGRCWDFSDLFVTLARAVDVPCRQTGGWLYGASGHVWAEYWREGRGWRQVDPTGGGRLPCGLYHVAYFASDDGRMPILYVGMPRVEWAPTRP